MVNPRDDAGSGPYFSTDGDGCRSMKLTIDLQASCKKPARSLSDFGAAEEHLSARNIPTSCEFSDSRGVELDMLEASLESSIAGFDSEQCCAAKRHRGSRW